MYSILLSTVPILRSLGQPHTIFGHLLACTFLNQGFFEQSIDHVCDCGLADFYILHTNLRAHACGRAYTTWLFDWNFICFHSYGQKRSSCSSMKEKHIHVAGRNFGYKLALFVRSLFIPSLTSGTWAPSQRETDE